MVYQQCGPVCPQTCDNYDNAECSSGCVDGCFCPSETVLSYGYCINVSYCQGRQGSSQDFLKGVPTAVLSYQKQGSGGTALSY